MLQPDDGVAGPRPSVLVYYVTYDISPEAVYAVPKLLSDVVAALASVADVSVLTFDRPLHDGLDASPINVSPSRIRSSFEGRVGPVLERRFGRRRRPVKELRRSAAEAYLRRAAMTFDFVVLTRLADASVIRETIANATTVCWPLSLDLDEFGLYGRYLGAVDRILVPSHAVATAWQGGSHIAASKTFEVLSLWPSAFFSTTPTPAERDGARPAFAIDDADAPVVLFSGGHVPGKGGDIAERALVRLADELPGLTMIRVGSLVDADGPEIASRTVGRLRVIDTVRLSRERVREAYLAADFGLVPTQIFETFGLVTVEMALAGLVPIVSGYGGLPEIVGDDDALIVHEFRDVDAWTAAVRRAFGWSADERTDHLERLAARIEQFSRATAMERWASMVRTDSHLPN